MKRSLALLAFLAAAVLLFAAVSAEGIDPGNPMLVRSMRAELWIHGMGTITGPIGPGDNLTLKILVPQSSENQTIESITETAKYGSNGFVPTGHETDKFGNRYAVFAFNSLNAREFEYDINAIVITKTYAGFSDYNVSAGFPQEMQEFIQPTRHAESNDATIRTIASSIMKTDSELESIASAAEWVNNYVEYDFSYWGRVLSARQVIDSKRGVCEEYSNLTAALLKAKGIPVRVVSGLVYNSMDWNNHAWVEAYVPGRGWVGVDPTYGEAGLLDGTHIEMGKTDDRSNASDQSYSYVGDFEVAVKDRRKVNVLSVEEFGEIAGITPKSFPDTNLLAGGFSSDLNKGQRFDLNAWIENGMGTKTILPMQLSLHSAFGTVGRQNRLLLLNPFEKRELSWQAIAPDANANYAYGYRIETMGSVFEGVIPVMGDRGKGGIGAGQGASQIIVKESLPTISQDETLELKLRLFNAGSEAADLNIAIYGSNSAQLVSGTEKLLPLESKELNYRIPSAFSQEFVVLKATARGFNYEEKVNISKGTELPAEAQSQESETNSSTISPAKAREQIRRAGEKAEEEFGFLMQNNLLVPLGIIVLLLLVLFGMRKSFRSSRL